MPKWIFLLGMLAALGLLSLDATAKVSPDSGKSGVKVSGKVVDSSGADAGAGVEVRLVRLGKVKAGKDKTDKAKADKDKTAGTDDAKPGVVATTKTDAKGKFSFSDVTPGRYAVVAMKKGAGRGRVLAPVDHSAVTGLVITLDKAKVKGKSAT